ncbi:S8 family serine peptidase [Alistipes sp.]|uniref:S8 family serine peptidase n=1 Tax=Alistipes sp. TaxID=1872444 RepID=UPI0025C4248B|nr:S8 family serine peptidase [Alistipes sp.]
MFRFIAILCALSLFAACTAEDFTQSEVAIEPPATTNSHSGRLRIKFRPDMEPERILATRSGLHTGDSVLDAALHDLGVEQMQRVFPPAGRFEERTRREGLHLWYDIRFSDKTPLTRASSGLVDLPCIDKVEPVYAARHIDCDVSVVAAAPRNPVLGSGPFPVNDPGLARQWHYYNDGSLEDALPGADIDLFRAWEVTTGSNEVVVAVVDGGIDYKHEDLAGNVGNWAELNGVEGVDDDDNGYVDDLYGWNFIHTFDAPYGTARITPVEHGTHVAGTIGAENNNGIGVCGIAGGRGDHSGVRLISCQMFSENRNDNGDEVAAIKYGADAGAVISQNSWGYLNVFQMPEVTRDAIDYFIKYAGVDEAGNQVGPMKGGIVIFAAGNDNRNYKSYPACYEKVVAVCALAPDYRKSWYSNYADWVDVAAPGGTFRDKGRYSDECAVYSTLPGNAYGYMQGTSMACPHVSGVAALAVSKHGGAGFTPDKLRAYLERKARPVETCNPGYEGMLGSGLIDAYLTLSTDHGIAPDPVSDLTHSNTVGEVELKWSVPADEDDGSATSFIILWRVGTLNHPDPDHLSDDTFLVEVPARGKTKGDPMSHTLTGIAEQTRYTVAIFAVDPWGNRSEVKSISFGTPANQPPVLEAEDAQDPRIPYNTTRVVSFLVNDPDSFGFTFELEDPSGSITPSKDGNRLLLSVFNYKRNPGTYTAKITVSDSFGASACADFRFELQPNQPPRLVQGFTPVYLGSLDEVTDFMPSAGFADEIPETLEYRIDYDRDMLHLRPWNGGYRIMPLRYGVSQITVRAMDEDGLGAQDSFTVLCRDDSRELDLYPNPVKDLLKIRMGRDVEGEIQVSVYDVTGVEVLACKAEIAPTRPAELNLSSLGKGTYTIRIRSGNLSFVRSIVKQ